MPARKRIALIAPDKRKVKALLPIAVVWNIPVACNQASADFMVSPPMNLTYERLLVITRIEFPNKG